MFGKTYYSSKGQSRLATVKAFRVDGKVVPITKATRRIWREQYVTSKAFGKISRILAKAESRLFANQIRAEVATVKRQKRTSHKRARSHDDLGYVSLPRAKVTAKSASGSLGVPVYEDWGFAVELGTRSTCVDYSPVQVTDPVPLNTASMTKIVKSSTKTDIRVTPEFWAHPNVEIRGSKVAAWLLSANVATPPTGFGQTVDFDESLAERALLAAQAKVYSADIHANEYLVEWRQVLQLLVDPKKSALRLVMLFKHWFDGDKWIYLPGSTVRRFGKGFLKSSLPTGGVLMSLRTRRELSVSKASESLINEACNRWLQWRYGIAPILSDFSQVMDKFVNPVSSLGLKASKARYSVSSKKTFGSYTVRLRPLTYTFKYTVSEWEDYSAKQWYDAKAIPLSYRLGLHPSQFIQVLWNAFPGSFVLDWAYNVDQWLTGTRDPSWIRLRANHVTHTKGYELLTLLVKVQDDYGNQAVLSHRQPVAKYAIRHMRREINLNKVTALPTPNAWLSLKNIATSLALIKVGRRP